MKRVELLIDESEESFGVEALSLVKFPAIESGFIFFKKDEMLSLAAVDEDKRMLIGPALIPDKNIPRYDEFSAEEYEVYFSQETVKRASELFLKQSRTNMHTFEHESAIEAVHVVESWIVENPDMDKSRHYGLNVPKGTWMVKVDVSNDEMWSKVKDDEIRGFSIEGYFVDKVEHMAKQENDSSVMSMLKSIYNKLTRRDLYSEVTLSNGSTLITEAEDFAAGVSVQVLDGDGQPTEVKTGPYTTAAGVQLTVEDSVLTRFGEAEVAVAEEEATEGQSVEHWVGVIKDKMNMKRREMSGSDYSYNVQALIMETAQNMGVEPYLIEEIGEPFLEPDDARRSREFLDGFFGVYSSIDEAMTDVIDFYGLDEGAKDTRFSQLDMLAAWDVSGGILVWQNVDGDWRGGTPRGDY